MNLYLLLKTLHILSSTILFGTGLGSAYYALRAWRSGQLPVIAVTFRHLVAADWLFIATTAVFQPLSGLDEADGDRAFHHCLSFKIKVDMKIYRNSRASLHRIRRRIAIKNLFTFKIK